MTSHNEPTTYIYFENVPIEKMDDKTIPSKLDEVFNQLMSCESNFNLKRLRTFVDRSKLNVLSSLDNCPHESLSSVIIKDFLYGKDLIDVSC
jgi:hypothetical protein